MSTATRFFYQFALTIGVFAIIWFLFSKLEAFKPQSFDRLNSETEKKLAELVLESISKTNRAITSKGALPYLDSLKNKICERSHLNADSIKLHLIKKSEVNAFALPDHNIVIYTGLIDYSASAEEVAGVLAHEIAHIELDHVEKKLVKEIGLGMLLVLVSGDAGPDILREVVHALSSTAFDRGQESEADKQGVHYLAKSNIDPRHLSNFLFRLSRDERIPEQLEWLSTHPDSKDRAAEILKLRKTVDFDTVPPLQTSWALVKERIRIESER